MMKSVNFNICDHFPYCQFHNGAVNYNDTMDEAIYGSDEFRMYAYKIKRCLRTRSHDWTECPYAHRGEKAQRRDPRKVPYSAIACPAFRGGRCLKGDICEFAHGVFEYWLHPTKYRTRPCNAGVFCQRKVCFFAHTPDQLRSEGRVNKCPRHQLKYRVVAAAPAAVQKVVEVPAPAAAYSVMQGNGCFDGVAEFVKSLRKVKIEEVEVEAEDGGRGEDGGGGGVEDWSYEMPHIGWISELVN